MNYTLVLIVLQLFLSSCLGKSISSGEVETKLETKNLDVKTELGKLNSTYIYQSEWPDSSIKLGAVTAVSFDKSGNVVIFHRVDRIWSYKTFDWYNVYGEYDLGPIDQSTVLGLDKNSGKLVYDWGKNIFYMPHGLTVDSEDNVWVTDVALHQVMKFGPRGSSGKPLLTLGTAFKPGNSDSMFCKPTSVAVLPNGDFFVADGYCNSRIIKYSSSGEKIIEWGLHTPFSGDIHAKSPYSIPHALTLVPDQDLVCTADRENGRVLCFSSKNGTFQSQFWSEIIGNRVFSMDYTPAEGGQMIVVNAQISGPQYNEVLGYVFDMKSNKVVSKFGPNALQFLNPHDIAVTADGAEIYVVELDPYRVHKFIHKQKLLN